MKRSKRIVLCLLALLLLYLCACNPAAPASKDALSQESEPPQTQPVRQEIVLSFAGDCTIGMDDRGAYAGSLCEVYDKQGAAYFFRNVQPVLAAGDYTVVNLEGVFTRAKIRRPKSYNFKGPAEYAEILTQGGVSAVNLANNHTQDYYEVGYQDTLEALDRAGIAYFGGEQRLLAEIKGIRVGFLGIQVFASRKAEHLAAIEEGLRYLKNQGAQATILSFHWGEERSYRHDALQKELAYAAIDQGADLVVGHHPHVLQGIETYKGKQIVYSLGNFVFGGNRNPSDKDSMIFQQKFIFEDGELTSTQPRVIPVCVSSTPGRNDYQPHVLEGEEKTRVLEKIQKGCVGFDCGENA